MSDFFVSPLTAATSSSGLVIAIFYLRNMWLVLQRTAETLDEPDDKRPDAFAYSFVGRRRRRGRLVARDSGLWRSPIFLYVGVVLALLSPIAVGYTFYRELRD